MWQSQLLVCDNMWQVDERRRSSSSLFVRKCDDSDDDNMWQYVTIATIVYMTLCDNMWQVDDRRRPSGSLFSPKRETCEGIKEKEGATKLRPDVAKNVLWETKVFPDPEELLLHIKVYIQRREDADYMAVIWSEQCVSFLVPCVPICPMCPYL